MDMIMLVAGEASCANMYSAMLQLDRHKLKRKKPGPLVSGPVSSNQRDLLAYQRPEHVLFFQVEALGTTLQQYAPIAHGHKQRIN